MLYNSPTSIFVAPLLQNFFSGGDTPRNSVKRETEKEENARKKEKGK